MVQQGIPSIEELLGQIQGSQAPTLNINGDLQAQLESLRTLRSQREARRVAEETLAKIRAQKASDNQRTDLIQDLVQSSQPTQEPENRSFLDRVSGILEAPINAVSKPLIGQILNQTFRAIPGEQGGEKALREALGTSPFVNLFAPTNAEKIREALKETALPKGLMGTLEIALDPLAFIPVGKAGTALRGVLKATKGAQAAKFLGRAPDLPVLTDIVEKAMPRNVAAKMAERLVSKPVVREALGTVNPAALADDEISRSLLGYMNLLDIGDNLTKLAVTGVSATRFPFAMRAGTHIVFKDGTEAPWQDVFEFLGRYQAKMTSDQVAYITEYRNIIDDAFGMVKKSGSKIDEWVVEEEGFHYIPRFVRSLDGLEKVKSDMPRALGAKPSIAQNRFHQDVATGIDNGVNYLQDPIAVINTYVGSAYKMAADNQLSNALKPLGKTISERMDLLRPGIREELASLSVRAQRLKDMDDVINRVFRGSRESIEVSAFVRRFPELGGRLRDAYRMPGARKATKTRNLDQLYKEITKNEGQVASDLVRRLHQKGIDTIETHFKAAASYRQRYGLVTVRVASLTPAARGALTKAGAIVKTDPVQGLAKGFGDTTIQIPNDSAFLAKLGNVPKQGKAITKPLEFEMGGKVFGRITGDPSKGVARGQVLQKIQEDAKMMRGGLLEQITAKRSELARVRTAAAAVRPGEGRIAQPALQGRIFDAATAKRVNDMFSDRANGFLQAMGNLNAVARLGSTGFDLGAGMIQGFPLLATNPLGWMRAQKQAIQSFLDPKALERYKLANRADFQEMALNRVPISEAEFVEAATGIERLAVGTVGRIIPGEVDDKILRQAVRRPAAAFNAMGDAARHEFWKAMKPMAERSGRPEALFELGDMVGKLTGVSGIRKLGMKATQREIERGLFFAPRYFRASMGLLADAVQGGLKGGVARKSIAGMMAGGLTYYYGLSLALGQEPKLDPRRGDFLTFKVGEQRVGIGSVWVSMARFMADTYEQVERGEGFPISMDPQKSVLTRFTRYRSSPIAGFGWDLAAGRDPIGRPMDDPISLDTARNLGARFVPFWAQDMLAVSAPSEEGQPGTDYRASIPGEMLGMRTFPVSIFERRRLKQEELAQRVGVQDWQSLSTFQKKELRENDPDLKVFDQQIRVWNLESPDDLNRKTEEYFIEKEKVRASWRDDLILAQQQVADRQGTGRDFRDKKSEASLRLRTLYQANEDRVDFQPAIAAIKEYANRPKADQQFVEDIVFDRIMADIVLAEDLHDKYRDYDFQEAARRHKAIEEEFGGDHYDKAMARMRSTKELPPMALELQEGRELFDSYWAIGHELAGQANLTEEWEKFKKLPGSAEVDDLVELFPVITEIARQQGIARQTLRKNSPALDAWLFKYGYTTSLVNKMTMDMGKAIIQEWDFDTLALPLTNMP
jgi:transcriptional regulator with XRE-family HTH domain